MTALFYEVVGEAGDFLKIEFPVIDMADDRSATSGSEVYCKETLFISHL